MSALEYRTDETALSGAYSDEVLALAAPKGGVSTLEAFRQLALRCFPYAIVGNFEYVSDPGAGDEWLALSLRVRGPVRRFLRDQAAFFAAWSKDADAASERLAVLLPDFE